MTARLGLDTGTVWVDARQETTAGTLERASDTQSDTQTHKTLRQLGCHTTRVR